MNVILHIEPIKLARNQSTLRLDIPLNQCPGLQAITPQGNSVAQVTLHFGRDEDGFYYLKGTLEASVLVICHRCDLPMDLTINSTLSLSPVMNDGQAKSLPAHYDPILMQDNEISTITLVEEEILLSLPMIPKHAEELCPIHFPDFFHPS